MRIELELNEYQIDALEIGLLYFMRDTTHELKYDPSYDIMFDGIKREWRKSAKEIYDQIQLQTHNQGGNTNVR